MPEIVLDANVFAHALNPEVMYYESSLETSLPISSRLI